MSNYTIWGLFGPATWSSWLMLSALLAMLAGRRTGRWARPLLGAAVATFFVLAVLPTGYWLTRILETRFPVPQRLPADIAHVIVLTGSEDLGASVLAGRPEFTDAADRIIEGAALARALPRARLWIVGGVKGRWTLYDVDITARAWRRLGIPAAQITVAHDSFDTCQNAAVVAARRPAGRLLLVTSAIHMPRAMACFRANGLSPAPYPVDFRRQPVSGALDTFRPNLSANIDQADNALHEWIGLVIYRLTGRTDTLMPAA